MSEFRYVYKYMHIYIYICTWWSKATTFGVYPTNQQVWDCGNMMYVCVYFYIYIYTYIISTAILCT